MKRAAIFDSTPEAPSDSFVRSKRVMDEPSFNVHRAESSHQFSEPAPASSPLDVQRAEACQHVQALNSQFASWVQSQLRHHPDELWEDGVKDYLSHASHIMEKFKDVVDQLKDTVAKAGSASTAASSLNHGSLSSLSESYGLRLNANNGSTQDGKPTSFPQPSNLFSSSQGSGVFSINQTPAFTGSQSSTTPKVETSGDIDDENDLQQPSSPSLKKTEEEGIIVVHEAKCKVYVKPENPAEKGWKDMGMGQLSIKCIEGAGKATKEAKPTVIIRNDVGKILLNALLYPGIKTNIQKNTLATIFHTSGSGHANGTESGKSDVAVARTFLLRLKTEDETTKLASAINDYAPVA